MLIPRLLGQLDEEEAQLLLGSFFPEAEIPAVCTTTRRHFNRDNSAKLTRFFLDSQQEWASKLDLELPQEQKEAAKDLSVRLINGVAGSGKTLIAISRALMLAELFPSQQILVLIHNTPVVADIKEKLNRTRGSIPNNLDISTFSSWAHQQWRNVFQMHLEMPRTSILQASVKRHMASLVDIKQTEEQLLEELNFINDYLIISLEHYINTSRSGRGFALRQIEREQIWALYKTVTSEINNSGLRMWSAFPREICLSNESQHLQKYNHILIDEAQFFAPSWFQVVKLSVEPEGHLFLCADPNQGFMKNRLSWKSVGLDVAGRTKKLRKSYRTTQAILDAATHVLGQFVQSDPEDYLEPDFTGMELGTPPFLIYADTPQDAADRVTNEIAALTSEGQLPLASILVLYGNNIQKQLLYELLEKRVGFGKIWWLNKKEHKKEPPNGYGKDYLRLANIDTATGLEASVVFLIGLDGLMSESRIPGQSKDELAARAEENGRKLYMAMTRAGQRLVMVATQKLPSSIENLFQINS
jgi:superfamily I DNA/RNA helicase